MVVNGSAERMLKHGTGEVVIFGTRRDGIEITYDILRTARSGVTKTRIATKSYLNFQIGCNYIERLIDVGLLEKNAEGRFKTTEKGVRFLNDYAKFLKLINLL